jgi:hypothetical protein
MANLGGAKGADVYQNRACILTLRPAASGTLKSFQGIVHLPERSKILFAAMHLQ